FRSGIISRQHPRLSRYGALGSDEDELLGFGLADVTGEGVIIFLENQYVICLTGSKNVSVDLEGAESVRILSGVEQRPVVICPNDIPCNRPKAVFQKVTRSQVLESNFIDPPAHIILRKSQQLLIKRYLYSAHIHIILALREEIDIK